MHKQILFSFLIILQSSYLSAMTPQIEAMILKTKYAKRFAFLPDSSPFKQACSKVNENKEVNGACAILSNFLYCAHHPARANRPQECIEFCREFTSFELGGMNYRSKEALLALQKELSLDPKDLVDFMREMNAQATKKESPHSCKSNPKKMENVSENQEEERPLYC